jgi:adenylate cyclase
MKTSRPSVPFSITILALMALIIVPLAGALLWLGWHAVNALEQRNADQRVAALEEAVERFLSEGLRAVLSVGQTLAETPSFNSTRGTSDDEERRRALMAVLGRHPAVAAAFVGYADGRFFYAGRSDAFWLARRTEFDAPSKDSIVVRTIQGTGAERRETWWFQTPNGTPGPARVEPAEFDPRTRPWYIDALKAQAPVLTAPYRFAQSDATGISAGVPLSLGGGAIGFDFTLGTLSQLLTAYKITANSVIMVAQGAGGVEIESKPCAATSPDCLDGDAKVRVALRSAIREAIDEDRRIDREVEVAGRFHRLIVHRMPPALGQRFVVAAAVPVAELAAASRSLLEQAALAAAIAVGLAVLAALAASLMVSRSMARIAAKTDRIRNLDFSDREPVRSRITEVVRLSEAIERMREGLEIFGRYVSKNLVQQIMRSPESTGVGGTRREVTVMFTDIEGFSRLSETMEPELLTDRLSRYFDALGSAISANRGMIDKYIGDSIMAFWNAPEPDVDHITNACRAALQAAAAGNRLSEKWRSRGRPGFRTRFGLHTGPAVVGNVGARERINYTLVGAVANQASRMEGLNKVYGTEILASGKVADATADRFVWRHIDRIVAAGTTEVHEIYEPLGEIDAATQHAAFLVAWRAGHAAYAEGRFEAALAGFHAATALRPDDGPSRVFIERCAVFLQSGTPDGWDGTWHFDKK